MADPACLPLTSAQQRLWFIQHLDPDDVAYNICVAIDLRGPLSLVSLRLALERLSRRHDALRARFGMSGGPPWQRVDGPAPPVQLVDLLGDGPASDRLERLLARIAARPFLLDEECPARWILVRVAPERTVLVLAVHHIVFDGGSLGVLTGDLEQVHAAIVAGRPDGLPGHAPGLARLVARREVSAESDAFWDRRLACAPARSSPFPVAAADPDRSVKEITVALPLERVAPLVAMARRTGTGSWGVLMAAVAAAVSRYDRQLDVVLGAPVALRDDAERAATVGLLINILPLRVQVDPTRGFRELLGRCRDSVVDALEHRDTPFERIVRRSGKAGHHDVTPLFQVLLVHDVRPPVPRLVGVAASVVPVPTVAAKYDLTLTLTESGDETHLTFTAGPGVCDRAELAELARNVVGLLTAAALDPDRPVAELAGPGSEFGPRPPWSAMHSADPAELVPTRIARRARDHPDAVAAVDGGRHVTYRALMRRADEVAGRLRELGCGADSVCGVVADRSTGMVIAMVAVLRAGAAYLPIDPDLPVERVRFTLADAGATLLLTDRDEIDPVGVRVLRITEPAAGAGPPGLGPVRPSRQHLAYVLYTSGSTGRPKGVAVQHDSLAAFIAWAGTAYDDEEMAVVAASTSLGFDPSVFELFATLVVGGTVVLAPDVPRLAAQPWLAAVTLLNTVPSGADVLLSARALPRSLRTLNLCGEPLRREIVDRLHAQRPGVRVRNLYGPAEATVYATEVTVEPGAIGEPSIGVPIGPARVWVGDYRQWPAPMGAIGELFISGVVLARGYWSRPGLTADRFRPDPSGPIGGRLYRTGDLARIRGDRRMYFVGRDDTQVKIRGMRIELGEVEAELRRSPAVREAVVVLSGARLVGFVRPEQGTVVDVETVLAALRARLPVAAVPNEVVVLDEMPRTANGKTDRSELSRRAAAAQPADATAPRTDLERRIATFWSAVLDRESVDVHEGFFDAGGTSMSIVDLHRLIAAEVAPDVRLVDLFHYPTIAAQANRFADVTRAGDAAEPGVAARADARRRAAQRARRRVVAR